MNLLTLKSSAMLIGLQDDAIVNAEKIYGELIEKYRAALKGLKTRDAAGLASLAGQLHDADHAAVAALESLSQELEKRCNRVRGISGGLERYAANSCVPFERNAQDNSKS